MKNDKQKPKVTKAQKGCLIFVIVLGVIFIIAAIATKTSAPDNITISDWDTMSYENKQSWIEATLKGPAAENSEIEISKSIKARFNYPEEVHFDAGNYPRFSKGDIVDADSGKVFFRGTGTAKNGFGVKSRFIYSVMTIIRPDTMYINDVSISEPN